MHANLRLLRCDGFMLIAILHSRPADGHIQEIENTEEGQDVADLVMELLNEGHDANDVVDAALEELDYPFPGGQAQHVEGRIWALWLAPWQEEGPNYLPKDVATKISTANAREPFRHLLKRLRQAEALQAVA